MEAWVAINSSSECPDHMTACKDSPWCCDERFVLNNLSEPERLSVERLKKVMQEPHVQINKHKPYHRKLSVHNQLFPVLEVIL